MVRSLYKEEVGDELPETIRDVYDLLLVLWRYRWWIIVSSMVVVAVSSAYAFLATSWYTARAVIVSNTDRPAVAGLGRLGGLADLAGIRINDSSSPAPIAYLQSRALAGEFISSEQLTSATADLHRLGNDLAEAVDFFDKHVRLVYEDKKTGLIHVSMSWTDADTAARWTNSYLALANRKLRDQAKEAAEKNIEYLRNALSETPQQVMQQAISEVLEVEMQKLLLTHGDEYAFRIIDPAVPPRYRARPVRALVIAGGAVVGGCLGCLLALVSFGWARKKLELRQG